MKFPLLLLLALPLGAADAVRDHLPVRVVGGNVVSLAPLIRAHGEAPTTNTARYFIEGRVVEVDGNVATIRMPTGRYVLDPDRLRAMGLTLEAAAIAVEARRASNGMSLGQTLLYSPAQRSALVPQHRTIMLTNNPFAGIQAGAPVRLFALPMRVDAHGREWFNFGTIYEGDLNREARYQLVGADGKWSSVTNRTVSVR